MQTSSIHGERRAWLARAVGGLVVIAWCIGGIGGWGPSMLQAHATGSEAMPGATTVAMVACFVIAVRRYRRLRALDG